MLSLPDFKQKQILFINTLELEGKASLKLANENIVYLKDDKIVNRISCYKVFCVFVIGDFTFTSKVIQEANDYGVSFFLLKRNFELYGYLQAKAEGNYLLRNLQYNLNENQELSLARLVLKNKIQNQLLLLKNLVLEKTLKNLKENTFKQIDLATDSNSLLGIEGNISKYYFEKYFKTAGWVRRVPRTKQDIPNLLLDIGYSYLFNFTDSLLQLHGFDTFKGFYHKFFFQRKSLTCDLMEPLRGIVDKALLKGYNLNQIDEKDFKFTGAKMSLDFRKSAKYSRIFMEALMDNKEDIYKFIHGFYLYLMNSEKNNFPNFKIKVR